MAIRVYDADSSQAEVWDMIGRVDVSQRRPCPTDGCGARQYRVEIQHDGYVVLRLSDARYFRQAPDEWTHDVEEAHLLTWEDVVELRDVNPEIGRAHLVIPAVDALVIAEAATIVAQEETKAAAEALRRRARGLHHESWNRRVWGQS